MTWDEINRKRLPFIRMGERLFKGMYNDIKIQLKEVIRDRQTPEQIIEAVRGFGFDDQIVQSAYLRFYTKTGLNYAKDTKNNLSGMELKDADYDIWLLQMTEYVRSNVGVNITSVIRTAYKDIESITQKAVELGIEEGWGMDKIAREIVKKQGSIDTWKALRIARTEVVAASGEGTRLGGESVAGNKIKVWISTFDGRSRKDHMAMDGVRVAFNEDFITPKGNSLFSPGDPKCIDPSDIINCRCGYEVIVEPEIY